MDTGSERGSACPTRGQHDSRTAPALCPKLLSPVPSPILLSWPPVPGSPPVPASCSQPRGPSSALTGAWALARTGTWLAFLLVLIDTPCCPFHGCAHLLDLSALWLCPSLWVLGTPCELWSVGLARPPAALGSPPGCSCPLTSGSRACLQHLVPPMGGAHSRGLTTLLGVVLPVWLRTICRSQGWSQVGGGHLACVLGWTKVHVWTWMCPAGGERSCQPEGPGPTAALTAALACDQEAACKWTMAGPLWKTRCHQCRQKRRSRPCPLDSGEQMLMGGHRAKSGNQQVAPEGLCGQVAFTPRPAGHTSRDAPQPRRPLRSPGPWAPGGSVVSLGRVLSCGRLCPGPGSTHRSVWAGTRSTPCRPEMATSFPSPRASRPVETAVPWREPP